MAKKPRAYRAGEKRAEAIGTLLNRLKNEEDSAVIKSYDYETGQLLGEVIIEDVNLMYQNNTAKNYLIGLQRTLLSHRSRAESDNDEFYKGLFEKLSEENERREITIGDVHG